MPDPQSASSSPQEEQNIETVAGLIVGMLRSKAGSDSSPNSENVVYEYNIYIKEVNTDPEITYLLKLDDEDGKDLYDKWDQDHESSPTEIVGSPKGIQRECVRKTINFFQLPNWDSR